MSRVVWKYPLALEADQTVTAHCSYNIRHVGYDGRGALSMWIEHDMPDDDTYGVPIPVGIVATGEELPFNEGSHEGTVVSPDGFVWHVYDLTPFDERF